MLPLRNEHPTSGSASTRPRSGGPCPEASTLPAGKNLNTFPAFPGAGGKGPCSRPGAEPMGGRSASQNEEGRQSCRLAPSRPTRLTLRARPSWASACPPPARSWRRPTGGHHPAPTVHPPAGAKRTCPRSLHTGLGNHRLPRRQIHWQGRGLYKTLELSRLQQLHLRIM